MQNRVINLVGDSATGKTLLAEELCRNYADRFPDAPIYYNDVEAALDPQYAEAIGFPLDRVTLVEDDGSVEAMTDQVDTLIRDGEQCLYVLDSLDALSDVSELASASKDTGYDLKKAKLLSKFFRKCNKNMSEGAVTFVVVSQTRTKIGVVFGNNVSRSGGKSLDFYASQIIYLQHIGRIVVTRQGVKRPIGVRIKAQVTKNRGGAPFRVAEFPIYFGFGIDDAWAGVNWLLEVKRTDAIGMTQKDAKALLSKIPKLSGREWRRLRKKVNEAVAVVWQEVEALFDVERRKYE